MADWLAHRVFRLLARGESNYKNGRFSLSHVYGYWGVRTSRLGSNGISALGWVGVSAKELEAWESRERLIQSIPQNLNCRHGEGKWNHPELLTTWRCRDCWVIDSVKTPETLQFLLNSLFFPCKKKLMSPFPSHIVLPVVINWIFEGQVTKWRQCSQIRAIHQSRCVYLHLIAGIRQSKWSQGRSL